MKIPLPSVIRKPDAKAHSYPFQIGIQTQEFLQATILYAIFIDIAAGEAVSTPDGFTKIENKIINNLPNISSYHEAWKYLEKYRVLFEKTIFQFVLIGLNSHWDWYVRKLGDFIKFARIESNSSNLSVENVKRFKRLGQLPIIEQIEVLEAVAKITVTLTPKELAEVNEMSLARNLGLHNRWEIDEKYLSETNRKGLALGDIRIIDKNELFSWHSLLVHLINQCSKAIAITFVNAPQFP